VKKPNKRHGSARNLGGSIPLARRNAALLSPLP